MAGEKINALIIVAHPDDESFLFAGTTLVLEEQGKTVAVLCATKGEKGTDRLNRNLSEEKMASIRTQELLKACSILGCQCKKFFGLPDGHLDEMDFGQLISDLTEQINTYQPEIILTFGEEGITGHRDHIIIGKAAIEAGRKAQPKPDEVWLAGIPQSQIGNFNAYMNKRKVHHGHYAGIPLVGVPDEDLTQIEIKKFGHLKHQAIKAHQSQDVPGLLLDHFLAFEYFQVVKL